MQKEENKDDENQKSDLCKQLNFRLNIIDNDEIIFLNNEYFVDTKTCSIHQLKINVYKIIGFINDKVPYTL